LFTTSVASASLSTSSATIEQRRAALRDLLEHRQQVFQVRQLFLVNEQARILEHDFHALGIRHEIGRQVAAIELHALDDLERGVDRLRLFDGDDAVLADFLHRLGDDLADRLVVVGRNGADLRDHIARSPASTSS
jgi:hypothetical protein